MHYETNCMSCGSIDNWNKLMKGARKCNYKRLVARIKKEIPVLDELEWTSNTPFFSES